ncbi:hypothetical protein [Pseudomonas leptonychotis]|jgi:hypothetical protein|uniref:Uncharacterized protein n=1 Tax=Pseudomonas leptonychotis TaxID=2448482 RepID=A0A4T1ZUP8_9PSED|nr:hypothetical protein [Pseudomonas leptonychotis]TIH08043.1 hypothetical protein D8779_10970 [Pseudomonas leptonychotis]|tara:strand:+ start:438 stop:830 length:393 start_codon:yes stop_codon:yes gene_type:complete
MQQMLMTIVLLGLLTGCAQPQRDQPRANGTYLVIENSQAWAVLVFDGKRIEERGTVVDVIRLPNEGSAVAASYVIETANCGRVQWLSERSDAADGMTNLMLLHSNNQLEQNGCVITDGLSRVWTVLDYSS